MPEASVPGVRVSVHVYMYIQIKEGQREAERERERVGQSCVSTYDDLLLDDRCEALSFRHVADATWEFPKIRGPQYRPPVVGLFL